MSKRDLLVEIGLEEMPARFVTDAMNQLAEKLTKWLQEKNIAYTQVEGFSTPRRLAVVVTGLAEKQEDLELEAKGPAKKIAIDAEGNFTKAAIGFSRGQGATPEDIYFKEINGIEYAHVTKFVKGMDTKSSLVELEALITSLSFPKNMRWGNEDLRFVRPIKWLLTLFGTEVIPFSITGVATNKKTMGHRFLGEEIEISSPDYYSKQLLEQFVIVNPVERKEAIRNQIKDMAEENNWVIPIDEDLLEEVNNLVEYPTALYGKYEEEFLNLPEEVLITSMKEHQRYFPVKNKEGKLLPYFVTVRNGDHNHLENVAKGNEKVLRARLSDADFFYKEDQKLDINALVKKLDSIVYHEELGSLGEKVKRIQTISTELSNVLELNQQQKSQVKRTAEICKFDLVTNMVYEFPELQGFMGERYAKMSGEDEVVATGIYEHYAPRHSDDAVPHSTIGAVVSVADKLDTIVGCFSIGIIPTGSQDPYALRRQSAGIVQILLEKKWDITLEQLIEIALELHKGSDHLKRDVQEVKSELINFFKLRIKNALSNREIRFDLVDAVLGSEVGNIGILIKKAEILDQHKDDTEFKGIIESLSRILNISKKGEKVSVNPSLFESTYEKDLFAKYELIQKDVPTALQAGNVNAAFEALASLRETIDLYFDHTMVMANDESLKQNRLAQMIGLAEIIYLFADFNAVRK